MLELFPDNLSKDARVSWLRRFAEFVYEKNLQGSVAECGVYRGEFAKYINMFFSDRKCYLFDTFEGFHEEDIASDLNRKPIDALLHRHAFFVCSPHSFKDTSADNVVALMQHPENVIIKKGRVPETFGG